MSQAITHVDSDLLSAAQVSWLHKQTRQRTYKTSWLLHHDAKKVLIVIARKDGTYLLYDVRKNGRASPQDGLGVCRA